MWQPIETAPKGVFSERVTDPGYVKAPLILLRFGDEGVSVAKWDWYYSDGGAGFERSKGCGWYEPCSGDPLNLHYSTPPTHWMPVPEKL